MITLDMDMVYWLWWLLITDYWLWWLLLMPNCETNVSLFFSKQLEWILQKIDSDVTDHFLGQNIRPWKLKKKTDIILYFSIRESGFLAFPLCRDVRPLVKNVTVIVKCEQEWLKSIVSSGYSWHWANIRYLAKFCRERQTDQLTNMTTPRSSTLGA